MRVCIVLHADLFEPWPIVRPMNEARVLQRLGREVWIYSWIKDPSSPLPDQESRDGLRVRRHKLVPPKWTLARALGFPSIARRFADEIIAIRPDAILCHDLEMLWAATLAGRRLAIPVLYHAHEDWPAMVSERSHLEAFAFEHLERRLLRYVDHVYAAGEDRAERFRRWGKPVTVIYGAKPWAEIPQVSEKERLDIRARAGFAVEDFVLGISGSFGRNEAFPTVLDAIEGLDETVKLFIVGGVDAKVRSGMELVAQRGLTSRVVFSGRLPTDVYLRTTATLDVGLALYHPRTRNDTTLVPLKLFDYMAMGIPVIASDFPELRRILTEECRCGFVVNPQDVAGLRAAILFGLQERQKLRELGHLGQLCFRARFCWEKQEEKLLRSNPIYAGN